MTHPLVRSFERTAAAQQRERDERRAQPETILSCAMCGAPIDLDSLPDMPTSGVSDAVRGSVMRTAQEYSRRLQARGQPRESATKAAMKAAWQLHRKGVGGAVCKRCGETLG